MIYNTTFYGPGQKCVGTSPNNNKTHFFYFLIEEYESNQQSESDKSITNSISNNINNRIF